MTKSSFHAPFLREESLFEYSAICVLYLFTVFPCRYTILGHSRLRLTFTNHARV